MHFAFSWEFPAAVIGAVAVCAAAGALIVMIARAHHGPSHAELLLLGVLAIAGVWTWNTRVAVAQRLFPDGTGVIEEEIALQLLTHGDCAAFVAQTGQGKDDGAVCVVRVFSLHGRHVAPNAPRKSFESACDVTLDSEIRTWTFARGALKDWCAR